jgi:uncharacterized hydantoinase/oxoprolinase family protein
MIQEDAIKNAAEEVKETAEQVQEAVTEKVADAKEAVADAAELEHIVGHGLNDKVALGIGQRLALRRDVDVDIRQHFARLGIYHLTAEFHLGRDSGADEEE